MFSVIGVGGGVFRGSLEHLLAAHRVPPLRHLRGIDQDVDEPATEAHVGPASDDRRYHAAAAAYAAAERPHPERGPIYHAYQVMSRHVLTLSPEVSVVEAWRALAARGVGQAPVVSADRHLVGLISRTHLLHVLNEEDGRLRDVLARTVADVMDTPVVSAEPIADVRRIARVMLEYHVPALPIVDESSNVLVGIVSRSDILRCVVIDPPLTLWA